MRIRVQGLPARRGLVQFIVAALVIPGCMSVPDSTYHTLDMAASGNVEATGMVDVDRFYAVDALTRPGIMILAAPTRVEYYATEEWVADLAQLVEEKLQNEFGPAVEPQFRIMGDILRFEQVDSSSGADARVKLAVRAFAADEGRTIQPILQRTYEQQVSAGSGSPDEVVRALSTALEDIAVQIAGDLSTL